MFCWQKILFPAKLTSVDVTLVRWTKIAAIQHVDFVQIQIFTFVVKVALPYWLMYSYICGEGCLAVVVDV